ncbi:MAG: EAL domain-containing protein [Coprococcus sp.]|nr:EAL domain-containing protein [Coprococcus sp.]
MENNNHTVVSSKSGAPLLRKIFVPMICLVILQMLIFLIVLVVSGEFSYLKMNSYNSISEKTENRKNYVEGSLNQAMLNTKDTVEEINAIVSGILVKEGKTAADIGTDKELDKKIVKESAYSLIGLIRKDSINDAFIILNSDGLYNENGSENKTGLYLRDTDVNENSNSDNRDIFIEMGSSEISRNLGLALDYEWSLYIDMTNKEDFDFYYETMEAGKNNPKLSLDQLGHWTKFSKISRSAQESFKYTIPLISDDGCVYGVVGIGLLEKTVQQNMPSKDFMNESACYIIAVDYDDNGRYSMIMHSGPAYKRLVEDGTEISQGKMGKYNMYNFSDSTKTDCIGSIQDINLYKKGSPFKYQRWVLISVADREKVLSAYLTIIKTLVVSLICSLIVSIILSIIISGMINSPVKKMIHTLNSNRDAKELVQFASSGIIEIDELAISVRDLQARVMENASRLSRIISMAGSGIGVFMYDLLEDKFFVGESLNHLFDFDIQGEGDITMSADQFWSMIHQVDAKERIKSSRIFTDDDIENDSIKLEYTDEKKDESKWVRLNMYRDSTSVIGLAQDITDAIMEMKKIEYERDYDITTGLLNRRAFYYKLGRLFSAKERLKTAACFMFDLDNLKYVNDTYGHDFGDDYIRAAAGVFRLFESGKCIVARLSGDEFILFCYGYNSQDEIRDVKNRLQEKLRESYCVLPDGSRYKMRASGGIAWYPQDATDSDLLIKYADFAMYTIKHSTKGNIGEFDRKAYQNDAVLVTGIEELNRIIDEGSIRYAFQSIISAKTGEIYGYEALMRPVSEMLNTPKEFMRIAKADAKLNEVERLTWLYGLKEYKRQVDKGTIGREARIFLNTIPNNMIDDESVAYLEETCGECLQHIVLEILESEQVNDEFINKKKELISRWDGILALDDFGTGYNSEYALLELQPDLIKIDYLLISGCDQDTSRSSIIQDIVNIAKRSNIIVLAEGIETYDEMKVVIQCGVDLLQGFYLSKPLYEPIPLSEERKKEICELAEGNLER